MARFDNFSPLLIETTSTSALVEVPIPKPVIIYSNMDLQDWKSSFAQKANEAVLITDKVRYIHCLKTLMLAEFCNSISCVVRISNGARGLAVNFYFEFLKPTFLEIFLKNLESIAVLSSLSV